MKLRETVSREIAKAMRDTGITNAELARRMKCSPVTSLLMVQDARNLQLDTLERIAKALGKRVAVTLGENSRHG